MKKIIFFMAGLATLLSLSGCGTDSVPETAPESTQVENNEVADTDAGGREGNHGGGRNGGNVDKSNDVELQNMISEIVPKFELLSYTDQNTGVTLDYYLFTPSVQADSYPLLQFIPDASVVGKDGETVLTQGWGGLIWAADSEQAKHPCYVLVPIFTETIVNDKFEVSNQVEAEKNLIDYICQNNPIDTKRIYTTGQSMGGMTSFHMNITYPDLFAASVFVGSQWNVDIMQPLENKTFFYIVSAGDPKASVGQAELKELFNKDNAAYSSGEWSAQADSDTQNNNVKNLIAENNKANFITFEEGTTLADGQEASGGAGEHMTSFDYAYKLEAVRDWLFNQSK